MVTHALQDRTGEFRACLAQATKKQTQGKVGAQRQSLLTDTEKRAAGSQTRSARSEFARRAVEIGRGISGTMEKLERLAQLARRKSLFDDRPVEIAELTYVIKQDLASLNGQISSLQSLTKTQHPSNKGGGADQEGEHNKNVVMLLQGRLADVGSNFKDVLEVRTKNIQASRSRTENFVSSVSAQSKQLEPRQSASPLYTTPTKSTTPQPGGAGAGSGADILNLDPSSNSTLSRQPGFQQSDQQLLMMEEAQPTNTYINARGEAIEAIERTINELGGIFGQLATMVSEQAEQIQRIDANTEDVVDNVEGAQRELMKYWNRVQGNRWLVAKMFGVLMVSFFASCPKGSETNRTPRSSSSSGYWWQDRPFTETGVRCLFCVRYASAFHGLVHGGIEHSNTRLYCPYYPLH
jgi:syntaxin 5